MSEVGKEVEEEVGKEVKEEVEGVRMRKNVLSRIRKGVRHTAYTEIGRNC